MKKTTQTLAHILLRKEHFLKDMYVIADSWESSNTAWKWRVCWRCCQCVHVAVHVHAVNPTVTPSLSISISFPQYEWCLCFASCVHMYKRSSFKRLTGQRRLLWLCFSILYFYYCTLYSLYLLHICVSWRRDPFSVALSAVSPFLSPFLCTFFLFIVEISSSSFLIQILKPSCDFRLYN